MSSSNDSKPDNYQINARICRQVSRYPCMYDRSHQFYLKKDVVDKAWVKIAKEMNDSIPSCKERWRNIRTSFARSINVNKIPASANRTKPYYLHEELQFLARHITPGIPVSRRSNNAYYSAGEESEVIEVSVGEESFDGFVNMVQNDAEEDDESEEEQESSVDDGNNEVGIIKDEQQLIKELPQVSIEPVVIVNRAMTQTRDESNARLDMVENVIEAKAVMPEATVAAVARVVTPILCPPKKRRIAPHDEQKEMTSPTPESESEQSERDVKPLISHTPEPDFDAVFLQNLVPEMKAMDFRQKLIFKRRIYEVIGEIFETPSTCNGSSQQPPVNYNNANKQAPHLPPPTTLGPLHATAANTASPSSTMTVVNAADLAMIRRLNNLLQSPTGSIGIASSTTVTAVPKNHTASISSTVRSTPSSPATVSVHRGALTRSSAANLLRVTMVSAPSSSSSSTNAVQGSHVVKQEREDDIELLEMVD